jgi:hypothetical protein
MDVQAVPPTFAALPSGQPPVGNPPVLGQQVPGMAGGLSAQGGLSVLSTPLASQLQSAGTSTPPQTYPSAPNNPIAVYAAPATNAQSVYPPAYPLAPPPSPASTDQQAGGDVQQFARGGIAHAAERTQNMGRGEDTMLVHMTPNEVSGLQQLAMAHGGSLTINPHTGLPEAGWLGKLLPTLIGAALAATGVGAPLAAGIVALGSTAATGSIKKGLMAGLGAFGGAGLAGAAGLGGALTSNAFGALGSKAGILGANMGLGATAAAPGIGGVTGAAGAQPLSQASQQAAQQAVAQQAASTAGTSMQGFPELVQQAASQGAGQAANLTAGAPGFTGNFLSRFGQATRAGLPTSGIGGMLAKAAPMQAGLGVLSGISGAMTPTQARLGTQGQVDNAYQGPYTAQARPATFAPRTEDILASSAERDYFGVDQPEIYNVMGQVVQPGSETAQGTPIYQPVLNPSLGKRSRGQPMYSFLPTPYMGEPEEGYADGGVVKLGDGAFVVDARTVSELGNGSSGAGQDILAQMGGRPIQGPGDGVSDSIPARIAGNQPARVARDEVVFAPDAVQRLGRGNGRRGADKLYALMDKAQKARRKSSRGHDSQLRKGLA